MRSAKPFLFSQKIDLLARSGVRYGLKKALRKELKWSCGTGADSQTTGGGQRL